MSLYIFVHKYLSCSVFIEGHNLQLCNRRTHELELELQSARAYLGFSYLEKNSIQNKENRLIKSQGGGGGGGGGRGGGGGGGGGEGESVN